MGTPIPLPTVPDPVPAGDPCDSCWGPGQPFGAGPTPESILATVFGIQKGPNWMAGDGEPPEGEFILNQNPSLPCVFQFFDVDLIITAVVNAPTSDAAIFGPFGVPIFDAFLEGACSLSYTNEENDAFKNGTITLAIPKVT